jgi:hypothetical protein
MATYRRVGGERSSSVWWAGAAWSAIPVPAPPPTWRRAARAYSRPTSRTAFHAAVLLSAFAMRTAFPSSDYYADSATPRAHQPTSSLPGLPPATRRARGASHVHHDPFDRVGSWLYPYSTSGGHSQTPAGHHAQVNEPDVERAAVNQSGVVAVHDPCPPGSGSLLKSRGFYHQIALALPFGLASTHTGVWQYRPAVTSSGTLHPAARDPALGWSPASPGRCISPGPAFQPVRMRCIYSVISFRMAPRGAGSTSRESIHARSSTRSTTADRR